MPVVICIVYCNIFFLFKLISHVLVTVEIRMSYAEVSGRVRVHMFFSSADSPVLYGVLLAHSLACVLS